MVIVFVGGPILSFLDFLPTFFKNLCIYPLKFRLGHLSFYFLSPDFKIRLGLKFRMGINVES